MSKIDEGQALEQVSARLIARFPGLAVTVVSSVVHDEHTKLSGSVRDYIPVLVERAARGRLAVISASEPRER